MPPWVRQSPNVGSRVSASTLKGRSTSPFTGRVYTTGSCPRTAGWGSSEPVAGAGAGSACLAGVSCCATGVGSSGTWGRSGSTTDALPPAGEDAAGLAVKLWTRA